MTKQCTTQIQQGREHFSKLRSGLWTGLAKDERQWQIVKESAHLSSIQWRLPRFLIFRIWQQVGLLVWERLR